MRLSDKQKAYIREANRRWNFKGGATRSGKTWLDVHYVLPARIRERASQPGLVLLLGVTRQTLERNILSPMRALYGSALVGEIADDGRIRLFGEDAWALGAGTSAATAKLRGASVKYAYGDEVAEWCPEVFELLKSRLDQPNSCFDGTYNPQGPTHWLCRFLRSEADIYSQAYGIDDNPFLPADFVKRLKAEYAGTVYYQRYILGKWAQAEGALFTLDPPRTADASRIAGGIAHIDAAYGGGDSTALTLARRQGDDLCLYGRLWPTHVDTTLGAIEAECRKYACMPVYCETNADKGYLARALRDRGLPVRPYAERENKFMKISTHLRKWWPRVTILEGTDQLWLDQILDYTETATHDDAPDSAACCCRLLERYTSAPYVSPLELRGYGAR